MSHKVQLAYFRITGKFLAYANCVVEKETLEQIWDEIHEMRRMGRLPGLRPNAGRDLFIIVDVFNHPDRVLHLVMPPFVNEDDDTPVRVPTGEMEPLTRPSPEDLPRTTTRDIVKIDKAGVDEETTPVDQVPPLPPPLPIDET
jgi:hypothetical protein